MNHRTYGNIIEVNKKLKISSQPTTQSIEFINEHLDGSTVLEIGCGSGIYAKLLRKKGVKVIATDVCRTNARASMAEFTNVKAINNMIEKNAVEAIKNYGQNKSLSLFLSFPLPNNYNNKSQQYDETALREFLGNKFFLIAMYTVPLSNKEKYDCNSASQLTGSSGFHNYLAEAWDVKAKLLLETGRIDKGNHCYLIYFERKTANKSKNGNNGNNDNNGNKGNNNVNGKNRKCPAQKANTWPDGSLDWGLDDTRWVVATRANGVKYWRRYLDKWNIPHGYTFQ